MKNFKPIIFAVFLFTVPFISNAQTSKKEMKQKNKIERKEFRQEMKQRKKFYQMDDNEKLAFASWKKNRTSTKLLIGIPTSTILIASFPYNPPALFLTCGGYFTYYGIKSIVYSYRQNTAIRKLNKVQSI